MALMTFNRKERLIALVGLVVAIAALAYGFSLDARGFAGNALAEFAGMVVSVLLAVLVVDRVLDSARKRRWALVSAQTIGTLEFAFVRAGLAVYLCLAAPRPSDADPFTMSMIGPDELAESFGSAVGTGGCDA